MLAATRSGDSDAITAWQLQAKEQRKRITSALSACTQEARSAWESVTEYYPLLEAIQLGELSPAESQVVAACIWPRTRVILQTYHAGAAAIVVEQRRSGLLAHDDFVLLSPSAGFRGGYDSVGERHDILGVDASRPTVEQITSSNAAVIDTWEEVATQHRARIRELVDSVFALWSLHFCTAAVTVQLPPLEAEALSLLTGELLARCLRCLWPVVRISIPHAHAAQLIAARALVSKSGVPASDADVVVDSIVELGGPGYGLANPAGVGSATVGACMTSQSMPRLVVSTGHGCARGQAAQLHNPYAWAPCTPHAECAAFVDPSRGRSEPLAFAAADFATDWVDFSLPQGNVRRFDTVADVSVSSFTSPPTSAVGVHYVLDSPDSQTVSWGSSGRHYGYSSFEVAGSFDARDVFDFTLTGITYRLACSDARVAPTTVSRVGQSSGGLLTVSYRAEDSSDNSREVTPLLLPSSSYVDEPPATVARDALPIASDIVEVLYHVTKASVTGPRTRAGTRPPLAIPGDSGAAATYQARCNEHFLGLVKGRSEAAPEEGFIVPGPLVSAQVRYVLDHDPTPNMQFASRSTDRCFTGARVAARPVGRLYRTVFADYAFTRNSCRIDVL